MKFSNFYLHTRSRFFIKKTPIGVKLVFSLMLTSKNLFNFVMNSLSFGCENYTFTLTNKISEIENSKIFFFVKNLKIKVKIEKESFIDHFPNCTNLDFSDNHVFDYSKLNNCKKREIKTLNISGCRDFPGKVFRLFPFCERLVLYYWYSSITPANLKLLKSLKDLSIDLPFDDMIGGMTNKLKINKNFVKYIPKVEKLSLTYCWYDYRVIGVELPNVSELYIERTDIQNSSFAKFPKLRKLTIIVDKYDFKQGMIMNGNCFQYCQKVEELFLQNSMFHDVSFSFLKNLKSLKLYFNQFLTDKVFYFVLQNNRLSLEKLDFDSFSIGCMGYVIQFENLKILNIRPANVWGGGEKKGMTQKVFEFLPKLKYLEKVQWGGEMNEKCVENLLKLENLKEFRCENVGMWFTKYLSLIKFGFYVLTRSFRYKKIQNLTKENFEEFLKSLQEGRSFMSFFN